MSQDAPDPTPGIADEDRLRGLLRVRFKENSPEDYSVSDLLYRHGTAVEALMYQKLFWPEFVELEGMVFWSDAIEAYDVARIRAVLEHHEGDRSLTEKSFNHVEVPYLFGNPDPTGEIDDDMYVDLARTVAQMWQARLELLYPGRLFVFDVDAQEAELLFFADRTSTTGGRG